MSRNIIIGPPGTGKTTKLLSIVKQLLKNGQSPSRICFVAFTRKAAHEAKHRAMEGLGLSSDSLPWFRTLHSLAFQQVGATKQEVMGVQDYLNIAGKLGLSLTIKGISEDGSFTGLSKGDRLLFMAAQARTLLMPLRDYWASRPGEDIYWYELEQVANTVEEYKRVNGKRDFTDIIIEFNERGTLPILDTLIVDEAQDLSPLQWDMVDKLGQETSATYIAGDDDQAIFKWAGADVDKFIALSGFQVVLPRSYRVPKKVQEVANRVITRCGNRIAKEWEPRAEDGIVEAITSLDQVDMSKGSWLLLGRNAFLLEQFTQHCLREGYIFDAHNSPVKARSRQAILLWESLLRGDEISVEHANLVYEFMSTRNKIVYGSKKKLERVIANGRITHGELAKDFGLLTSEPWDKALDKLPIEERQYFLAAIAKGEKLTHEPRIKVSTIHSVKGGEADNVVLCPDMAYRTFQEYQENPDDEHRVWYVAVTRARNGLYLLEPTTNYYYAI